MYQSRARNFDILGQCTPVVPGDQASHYAQLRQMPPPTHPDNRWLTHVVTAQGAPGRRRRKDTSVFGAGADDISAFAELGLGRRKKRGRKCAPPAGQPRHEGF